MSDRDKLVSVGMLRQRIAELEEEVKGQRRTRADGDPFFKHAEWMLAEFRAALRQAEQEYRPTSEVAALTGWDPQTLRAKARRIMDAADPGEGWREMLVRRDTGGDYSFCVSTVPVKRTQALPLAA